MEDLVIAVEETLRRLTNFDANTRKSVSRLRTEAEVRARLRMLQMNWAQFGEAWFAWKKAAAKCPDIEDATTFRNEQYDDAELDWGVADGTLNNMLAAMMPAPIVHSAANAVPNAIENEGGLRMKALDPPTFSGEIEDWVSFRDLFASVVTRNHSLTDVHRMQYLRAACQGKAADVIRHLEVSAGNFRIAWEALTRRFENERLLVSRLIKRLLELPHMTRECPIELATLLDGTTQVLGGLKVLKRPIDQWDDFLVVHTTLKLDMETRMRWERSIAATTDMPTFKNIDEYLSGVLRSFDAVRDERRSNNYAGNGSRRVVQTHVVESRNLATCPMCNGTHALFRCPRFLERTVDERRDFILTSRLCLNCISTKNHAAQFCTSRYTCAICQAKHHTLLHPPSVSAPGSRNPFNMVQQPTSAGPEPTRTVNTNVCQSVTTTGVLLPTAWVTVTAENGRRVNVRALIDPASEATLITEKVVQLLASGKVAANTMVRGVGGVSTGVTVDGVRLAIMSCLEASSSVNVMALVLPKLTSVLPSRQIVRGRWAHLDGLPLADPQFTQPGGIDLLIGADTFADVLLPGVRQGALNEVIAQQTIFGWIVTGTAMAAPTTIAVSLHVQIDGLLQQFWELEEVTQQSILSVEDAACETQYEKTTTRSGDGRYVVELPFRQGGRELGQSRANAVRRLLQMERRGRQYPQMYEGYRKFMRAYLELGHMEMVPPNEMSVMPSCYLPHHAVFKPDSTTTKLRVVFDATAATTNGRGLNSLLLTGPRLQETLAAILMRWRSKRIAISADVEKMYRQIWVHPAHQEYQRIVWRETEAEPISHYRLKTVTYGTASAPYMAVKTLQRLAEDERDAFPRGAAVLRDDFYVDDCLSGADTVAEAVQLKDELLGIMSAGGMRLMKWSSNCAELLQTLPDDYIECRAALSFDDDECIKALGIRWHPAADELAYKVRIPEPKEKMTKREVLSEIARLFDPLGLLAPILITAKITVQKLWLTGLGWDDVLPEEVCARWRKYQNELVQIEDVRIARWCGNISARATVQLHGFSDASQVAFAACIYARVQNDDGSVVVTLLTGKTKVAPIKQQSIPRLELCGAVLLARLLRECRQALRCDHAGAFAWTDSTVVLAWLRRHANVWPTFVANRVSEIQTTMNATQWQHVPGDQNPADVASRGIMPSEIRGHTLWWCGPHWLSGEQCGWPVQQEQVIDETLLEEKKKVYCQVVQKSEMFEMANRFSSWTTLVRITAICRRIIPRNRRNERALQADEIDAARRCWIRLAQQHEFGDDTTAVETTEWARTHGLTKLRPFIDAHGVIRVGGRLQNSELAYEERHPAILPAKNAITRLLIRDAHERVFHAGPQSTMGRLHQRYWILNERREVRSLVHNCVTCARARPRAQMQLMGNLPAGRVRATRPFLHTGVDYAGPIWSRTTKGRGHKATKSWIAVFICFCTKAVHLELVSDVSSAAFRAAFRRFTARRGACTDVYSDNGTNFVGADREMRAQLAACMRDDGWRRELSDSGTQFHFAPPGSPHFNGLAESTVKMAKSAMRKVIGEHTLTFEELATFLAQVEAALNSRPLCALPAVGDETSVLTPGHFLVGQPLTAVPEPSTINEKESLVKRWYLVQQLTQHFWSRWSREYLHQLQQRHKWRTPANNMEVGDVVLVHDELQHVTRWKMGRIVETHAGDDGHVRVATVKTAGGLYKRAVTKLSVLPIENTGM